MISPIAENAELLTSGLMPMPRNILPGYDSGVLSLAIGAFLLATIGFIGARRLWNSFFRGLTHSGPGASSAETAETTTGERWSMAASLIQTFVCEGLLIFSAIHFTGIVPLTPTAYFKCASLCALLCALLFGFQWMGYKTVAYAFAPHPSTDTKSLLRAFASTQSMLGAWLLLPALGALFYPSAAMTLVWIGAALYILARLLFIIKEFRIFYDNLFSLLYFFLYLCALEILPLGAIAYGAVILSPYVIT